METSWQPSPPHQQITFTPAEAIVEVNILSDAAGPTLRSAIAFGASEAIELVSPANKDRLEHRQAFLAKCETFLRQGISLVVVDVVTIRKANLHQALLNSLTPNISNDLADSTAQLYAAAYHPLQAKIDVWYETFDVGTVLPTMPLWLDADLCVPLMLQETYEQTCQSQRITAN